MWSVTISFIAVVIHFLYTDFFIASLGKFVRVIKVEDFTGARGVSGLSPEPGFLGAMSIVYMLLGVYFNEKGHSRVSFIYCICLSVFMLLISKSGTGYLYLLIILTSLMIGFFKGWKRAAILVMGTIVVGVFLLSVDNGQPNRGVALMKIAFEDGWAGLLSDKSVYFRVRHIVLAFNSFIDHPFGNGLGSYLYVAKIYQVDILQSLSALSLGVVEFGVWFIVLLIALMWTPNLWCFSFSYKLLAGLFLFVSFSVAFPATWLLLGVALSGVRVGKQRELKWCKKHTAVSLKSSNESS